MTRQRAVEHDPGVRRRVRSWARRSGSSAIRPSETRGRSAAASPTRTRRPSCPPCSWRWTPPSPSSRRAGRADGAGRRVLPGAPGRRPPSPTSWSPRWRSTASVAPVGRRGWAVEEVSRRHGDFALGGRRRGRRGGPDGRVADARIALFGVEVRPTAPPEAEAAVRGNALRRRSGRRGGALAAARELDPLDDLHASGAYCASIWPACWCGARSSARTGRPAGDE